MQHQQKKRKHLVDGRALANYLGLPSDQELKQARCDGTGRFASLPFYKVGSRILYDMHEVDDWLDQRRHVRDDTIAAA